MFLQSININVFFIKKLSSIPELKNELITKELPKETNTEVAKEIEDKKLLEDKEETIDKTVAESVSDENDSKENTTAAIPEEYTKYFKMIHFGVPKQAVKLKMQQEGLDPTVLE